MIGLAGVAHLALLVGILATFLPARRADNFPAVVDAIAALLLAVLPITGEAGR